MPTYEYKCVECEHVTSRTSLIAERDEPCPCEECEAETIKGFYSANTPVVLMKGNGWISRSLGGKARRSRKST